MSEWTPIERIVFRGGPKDGSRLSDLSEADLCDTITFPNASDQLVSYRKSGEFEQLRGVNVPQPYCRIWFYDWVP